MSGGIKNQGENDIFDKNKENLSISEIKHFLPKIDKFIIDLGNNYMNLEEKYIFIDNNHQQLKNMYNAETVKLKKSNDTIFDLKAENKFLKFLL